MYNHFTQQLTKRFFLLPMIVLLLLTIGFPSQGWSQTGAYTLNGGSASLSSQLIAATSTNQSSVYVLNSGVLSLTNCTTTKTGDTTSLDSSSQYGLNAGIYAKSAGTITLSGGLVTTNASGANGLFATGSGSAITMSNGNITAVGSGAHGVDVTYGGSITLTNVNVTSNGASSSTLATDFGGGTVTVTGGNIISADTIDGSHSAAIYSTGVITVTRATAASYADCGGVIDGANSISIISTYLTGKVEGFKTWKTAPASGYATITVNAGALTVTNGDGFYVTGETGNAAAANLVVRNGAVITASSGNILNVLTSSSAVFTALNETLSGHLVADSTSFIVASLDSTTLTGAVRRAAMTINSTSLWNVSSTSSLTSLSNAGTLSFKSSGVTLTDSGAFSSTGKLSFLLGSASNYNQIVVTGAATIGGVLAVDLENGYVPSIGQSFTILTRGSGSGSFSSLTSSSGLTYSVAYNTSSIVITITGVPASIQDWAMME